MVSSDRKARAAARWDDSDAEQGEGGRSHDPGFEDGLDELPPNVPPGFLGEPGLNLKKADNDGPHGLNAGITQEWTWEMTIMVVILAYLVFFPLAYVVLWRSRKVPRRQKVIFSWAMAAGLAYVAYRLLAG
jgi:hypothetical protein